ncbi:hypothetical protein PYCC9005_001979 [Savitreella phatthalungensis]
MSLIQRWKRIVAAPSAAAFTNDAELVYVTSAHRIAAPQRIAQQLQANHKGLASCKDKDVFIHETDSTLVLEQTVSFNLDFDNSADNFFMPGQDDSLFSGKPVQLVMIYSVVFSGEQVKHVRVFWDQATVLKQLGVIGIRGRGWPVYDGSDQCRVLEVGAGSAKASAATAPVTADRPLTATKDPHATLRLFETVQEPKRQTYEAIETRDSCKPTNRDYGELFVNADSARPDDAVTRSGRGALRQASLNPTSLPEEAEAPRKAIAPSAGRLARDSHFELNGDESQYNNKENMHSKAGVIDHNAMSSWDTPEHKQQYKARPDLQSHFGPQDGNVDADEETASRAAQRGALHGRDYNMARRGPPSASFDAFSSGESEPAGNIHNREYNMARRPPPQAQFSAFEEEQAPVGGNVHGREFNMGRRAPPSAQYDFTTASELDRPIRASQQQEHEHKQAPAPQEENIHGREFNMARRPPPQAQFDFVFDEADNTARSKDNIHGMEFNRARRGPPAPQQSLWA